jgi:hypothetical protein
LEEVGGLSPYILVALGLVAVAVGLGKFFYPKPPPLGFTASLGGHTRLCVSLICVALGGVLVLLGLGTP